MDLCSLWLWVWQCHHGFCRLHRLSLPFVMPEIYHEQFEQKMGTPTRHYHHYTDESIIKSGRPMSSALISQPFSLTLPCCTGDTSFMKSNWDDNIGRVECDRNQVSVSGAKTKVQFWYRYQSRFFFLKPKFFSSKFFKYSHFFWFLWRYKFLKAWNWTQIFKINLKIFNIWQQIWFKGAFYVWKNAPYYW